MDALALSICHADESRPEIEKDPHHIRVLYSACALISMSI